MVAFETLPYCVAEFGGVLGQIAEHRAQILQIEQQQALLVGDAEGDVEHALLHVVEVHHARQQQRPHLRDGGAHRMALLAEHVPEHRREFVGLIVEAEPLGAADQRLLGLADRGNARQVALDVGGKNRNAGARQAFGENLQGDGLAGAGCACDQSMTIGEGQRQQRGFLALADEYRPVRVDFSHQQGPPFFGDTRPRFVHNRGS